VQSFIPYLGCSKKSQDKETLWTMFRYSEEAIGIDTPGWEYQDISLQRMARDLMYDSA